MRAGYFWAGPFGGLHVTQGFIVEDYPTCLPPVACDRPEYAKLLVAHWAYVLAMDPRLIPIYPTPVETLDGMLMHDGGFRVRLEELPLERVLVPFGSGDLVVATPVFFGAFARHTCPGLCETFDERLT